MTPARTLPHVRFDLPDPIPVGPRLARGWRITCYEAAGATIRLGRRSRGIDRLLGAAGVRHGAFVGAWNPLSRPHPESWNHTQLDRLRRLAGRAGIAFLEGAGHAARPPWAERHLLLLADWRRCAVLAQRFRQHAILLVRLRAPSRLRVLR
ncbi:DUF3293 domain-containing protein [Roseomonas eburnea]|uniref:DUF3293 domain-containing protein n=1 Tax=Neoroseomonas eburnea TaxID=1346889 RepID=A0A9X9X8I0_9PROT|nr:DUF3293 domain-containing protein [Neoroseomonas eburnea]MBR0680016.1 DUF3293 domain-containing protein [Neoroseomonas eburnea]